MSIDFLEIKGHPTRGQQGDMIKANIHIVTTQRPELIDPEDPSLLVHLVVYNVIILVSFVGVFLRLATKHIKQFQTHLSWEIKFAQTCPMKIPNETTVPNSIHTAHTEFPTVGEKAW